MRNYRLVGCEAWNGSDSGNLTKLWTLHEEGAQQASRQAGRQRVLRQFPCRDSESMKELWRKTQELS